MLLLLSHWSGWHRRDILPVEPPIGEIGLAIRGYLGVALSEQAARANVIVPLSAYVVRIRERLESMTNDEFSTQTQLRRCSCGLIERT